MSKNDLDNSLIYEGQHLKIVNPTLGQLKNQFNETKEALQEGAEYCALFTDDENPISNYVYEKVGYKKKDDCADIIFI